MKGININCKDIEYVEMILSGIKTIETRRTKSLHPYIGKRVGLIETGKGKAMLKGYATIVGIKEYTEQSAWDADRSLHQVPSGDKFTFNGYKVGYILADIERIDTPVIVTSRGIISREI